MVLCKYIIFTLESYTMNIIIMYIIHMAIKYKT